MCKGRPLLVVVNDLVADHDEPLPATFSVHQLTFPSAGAAQHFVDVRTRHRKLGLE
jgi:hypothetical protein